MRNIKVLGMLVSFIVAFGMSALAQNITLSAGETDVKNITTKQVEPKTNANAGVAFPASVNVGTGETYTSLTNAGGVFQALNSGIITGNVVINITSDLTGETGAVALNQLMGPGGGPSTFPITFKPSGAARTISGSNANGIIKINGADNIIFDGSLAGGTDRSLTVTATANTGTIFWIASASASALDASTNTTIKNCIISGNTATGTIAGILTGSGTTLGNNAETPNNNTSIINNQIFRMQNAMYLRGAATFDQAYVVRDNTLGSTTAADKLSFRGMLVGNLQNFRVSNNVIQGVVSTATSTATMQGIQVALAVSNGLIERNNISDIKQVNTAGWGSAGIFLSATTTSSSTTISNNFIRDVASFGFAGATSADNGYGIVASTGGGYLIYFNTVKLDTSQSAAGSITAAILIETSMSQPGALNIENNNFVNQETVGTRYGIYNASSINLGVFSRLNYNNYFAQNVGYYLATRTTLADWQGALAGYDSNSKAVDPLFVSLTDLHLQAGSPLIAMGDYGVSGVNNDFDNEMRDNTPDIGADEIINGARNGTIPAGTYSNANLGNGPFAGPLTITGVLTFNGLINTNGNTLTFGCDATIVRSGGSFNYIYGGPVVRQFCAPQVFTYHVGTANALRSDGDSLGGGNAYTPVTASVTALGVNPSSLAVSVTDGFMAGVDTANSIDRFWTLTETGDITANLAFVYNDFDVNGNEALYKVLRRSGGMTVASPTSTVNAATNTASITGVKNFSDWSVGLPLVVAASVNIGGRVTTADGITGLPRVNVTVSGNTLSEPRTIRTNPFGYYSFEDLPVGTYVLTAASKQYTFTVPTLVISAEDNITGADFTANP